MNANNNRHASHCDQCLLLVDDDPTFCQVLGRVLEKRGYKVLIAHDLRMGTDLAEHHKPDYAVVDLRIGQESGLVLIETLTDMNSDIRVVILTGYASIATAVEAIKLGAIHYLTKPTTTDEIIASLHHDDSNTSVPLPERPLSVKRLEWEHLQKVLMEHNGNISAAARALGMHRRTLQRKLNKHPVRN
jgi:two-component system response regulator RegA